TFASSTPGAMSGSNSSNPNMAVDKFCLQFSGSQISPALLSRLQRELTTGERDDPNCPIGTKHEHAIGYVTVDLINSCSIDSPLDPVYWNEVLLFDNVLTGEYVRINPNPESGNYAGANPLVHIRAIPEGGTA